jgi:CRP/FNR family transcriptional regulator
VTHQEIAEQLNSSREVISRLLKRMEHEGEVKLGRQRIELLGAAWSS